MLIRLMPCMYPIHLSLGRLGSLGRKYRYSANCFSTLIMQMYHVTRSHKKTPRYQGVHEKITGGEYRSRTGDLLHAMQAL